MIKTYDIDLDDELVEGASRLFDSLGIDIDSAIKIFLKQSLLRKGFPFEIAVPEEVESGKLKVESEDTSEVEIPDESESPAEVAESADDIHGGITEDEESAAATVTSTVSAEIAARVAANEALVAEMRKEIGEKAVTPEFDENEDDGTHGDYDSDLKTENPESGNDSAPEKGNSSLAETSSESETGAENDSSDDEDEDETTPDNLFDAWDVGDEEDIGCK